MDTKYYYNQKVWHKELKRWGRLSHWDNIYNSGTFAYRQLYNDEIWIDVVHSDLLPVAPDNIHIITIEKEVTRKERHTFVIEANNADEVEHKAFNDDYLYQIPTIY